MNLYSIALFFHVVGAVLLFVLLTVEGVGLRVGFGSAQLNRILGPISAVMILVPGFYMVATTWGWKSWIVVGITAYVAIAVFGAITGVAVMRGRMSRQTAAFSWLTRVGLALGVLFDMTVKPGWLVSVLAVVAGFVVGAAVGLVSRREVETA